MHGGGKDNSYLMILFSPMSNDNNRVESYIIYTTYFSSLLRGVANAEDDIYGRCESCKLFVV